MQDQEQLILAVSLSSQHQRTDWPSIRVVPPVALAERACGAEGYLGKANVGSGREPVIAPSNVEVAAVSLRLIIVAHVVKHYSWFDAKDGRKGLVTNSEVRLKADGCARDDSQSPKIVNQCVVHVQAPIIPEHAEMCSIGGHCDCRLPLIVGGGIG